jgi:hypothetical protein
MNNYSLARVVAFLFSANLQAVMKYVRFADGKMTTFNLLIQAWVVAPIN